jgi:hypothetical protein
MTGADETGRRASKAPAGLEQLFASRPGAPASHELSSRFASVGVEYLAAMALVPTLDVDTHTGRVWARGLVRRVQGRALVDARGIG